MVVATLMKPWGLTTRYFFYRMFSGRGVLLILVQVPVSVKKGPWRKWTNHWAERFKDPLRGAVIEGHHGCWGAQRIAVLAVIPKMPRDKSRKELPKLKEDQRHGRKDFWKMPWGTATSRSEPVRFSPSSVLLLPDLLLGLPLVDLQKQVRGSRILHCLTGMIMDLGVEYRMIFVPQRSLWFTWFHIYIHCYIIFYALPLTCQNQTV